MLNAQLLTDETSVDEDGEFFEYGPRESLKK